ncbi:MAG: hypothetical protein WCZ86_06275 [Desulfurivibrionaceae bacterium]
MIPPLAMLAVKRVNDSIERLREWKWNAEKVASALSGAVNIIDPDSQMALPVDQCKRTTIIYDAQTDAGFVSDPVASKGVINRLEQSLGIVLQQIAFKAPDPQVTGGDGPMVVAAIEEYLKDCIGDQVNNSDAIAETNASCRDFLVYGVCGTLVAIVNGKPGLRSVDPVREMLWDPDAKEPRFSEWIAHVENSTWPELKKNYAEDGGGLIEGTITETYDALRVSIEGSGVAGTHADTDYHGAKVITLNVYDELGNLTVLIKNLATTGGSAEGWGVLFHGPSDFVHTDKHGFVRKFLPVRVTNDEKWQWASGPTSPALRVSPFQSALSRVDRAWEEISANNRGGWFVRPEGYAPGAVDDFMKGRRGHLIAESDEAQPPVWLQGAVPEEADIMLKDHLEMAMAKASGADPYASGGKVEGIKYAAEVNQISRSSGIATSGISSRWAEHWRKLFWTIIAVGRQFDKRELTIAIGGSARMRIAPGMIENGTGTVSDILDPTVDITVAEESMRFRSKDEQLQFAGVMLDKALQLAAYFPNSLKLCYENWLSVAGMKDITAHLAPPAPVMAPVGPDGGVDPSAQGADPSQAIQ